MIIQLLALWHRLSSPYQNLLHFNLLSINQPNHINARRGLDGLADTAADVLAAQDVPHLINDLQRGFTFIGDNAVTIAIEGKGFIITVFVPEDGTGYKHQTETRSVIRRFGD